MKTVLTAILTADVPVPSPVAPPGVAEKVQTVLNWGFWISITALVGALIVAGVKMAINNRRGEGLSEGLGGVITVLIGAAFVASASSIISALVG